MAKNNDLFQTSDDVTKSPLIQSPIPTNGDNPQLTPLMQQYHSLKSAYPDCLLLFRLGDFYELFFNDAVIASQILQLTLTRRGKKNDEDIPMCGVPFHAIDNYLAKLIQAGKKIAIAEQTDGDVANKRQLINRQVVRIITPGTILEANLLPNKKHNYLATLMLAKQEIAIAIADISTGHFWVETIPLNQLAGFLTQQSPAEIILPQGQMKNQTLAASLKEFYEIISPLADNLFHQATAHELLCRYFGVKELSGFGNFSEIEEIALGGLLQYLQKTQLQALPQLLPPKKNLSQEFLQLDRASFQSLEILNSNRYEGGNSLIETLDHTLTAGGARLLRSRLLKPLKQQDKIMARLNLAEIFVKTPALTKELKNWLTTLPDLDRMLSRICYGRGGPRDLASLLLLLKKLPSLKLLFQSHINDPNDQALLQPIQKTLLDFSYLTQHLSTALLPYEQLPLLPRVGGFIRSGFRADLDEWRSLKNDSLRQIHLLEKKYRQLTQVDSLKIKQNNIWGYYLESASKFADKLLKTEGLEHRQTLSNAVRFTSNELMSLGQKIADAEVRAIELELDIFQELVAEVKKAFQELASLANSLAELDLLQSNAEITNRYHYCKPNLLPNSCSTPKKLFLKNARHPVVEVALLKHTQHFTANDVDLNHTNRFMLITAPNMAGKSTYLRLVAIITLMAQSGFYVPAEIAEIAITDQIFSRVGAADDLARGQSTFMVEMLETAYILQNATSDSLIIMDEIGRGTATYDGLALALSITEFLHNQLQARVLFATHYHELTDLTNNLSGLKVFTISVEHKTNNGVQELISSHKLQQGVANKSYGIEVASMAGLPKSVIHRASDILQKLEQPNLTSIKNLS